MVMPQFEDPTRESMAALLPVSLTTPTTVALNPKKRLMTDIIREALQSSAPKRRARGDNSQNGTVSDTVSGLEDLLSPAQLSAPLPEESAQSEELIFDADGNIILSAAPVATQSDGFYATVMEAGVSGYEHAYKKTRITKWTPVETDQFFAALERHGSDLMLLNTAFPSMSASQIRAKFKAEDRKDPTRVSACIRKSKSAQLFQIPSTSSHPALLPESSFSLPLSSLPFVTPEGLDGSPLARTPKAGEQQDVDLLAELLRM